MRAPEAPIPRSIHPPRVPKRWRKKGVARVEDKRESKRASERAREGPRERSCREVRIEVM